MNLDELKRYAGSKKIPLGIVEKDYVLSVALSQLCKNCYPNRFIFKGGTAIKKAYFPDARFSVDLDFNFFDLSGDQLVNEVAELFNGKSILRVNFEEVKTEEVTDNKTLLQLRYRAQMSHLDNIRLDFTSREPVLIAPMEWTPKDDYDVTRRMTCEHLGTTGTRRDTQDRIYSCGFGRITRLDSSRRTCLDCKMEAPRRSEIPPSAFRVMSLEEILSEKIRACLTRGRPRDLYDIWFLQSKGVRLRSDMIIDKLRLFQEFKETIPSLKEIRGQLQLIEQEWDRNLGDLVPSKAYPAFQEAAEQTINALKESGWKD